WDGGHNDLAILPARPGPGVHAAPRQSRHRDVRGDRRPGAAQAAAGLFRLAVAGLMPDKYQIIGSARRGLTDEQFREHARQATAEFGTVKPEGDAWEAFARRLSFASAEPGRTESLAAAAGRAEREIGGALARL